MAKREGTRLLRASFDLFRQDKKMIWLPVLGGITAGIGALIVGGAVAGILAAAGANGAIYILAIFVAGLVAAFLSTFFNLAVVFAANDRIEGTAPTVGGSLSKAWGRRNVIFKWAFLAAVVGTAINLLEERLGLVGRIFGFLGGVAWAIATYLVLPVLAFENIGPIDAVKRSAHLFKDQWSGVTRTALRFGVLFLPAFLVDMIVFVGGCALMGVNLALGIPLAAVGFIGLVFIGMLAATANLYMRTILYRFATKQPVPEMGVDLTTLFAKN